MTQIVRTFILLSLLLSIVFCLVVNLTPIITSSQKIVEYFGVRELNGRRGKFMRKCIGSSTNDTILQSTECVPETFINQQNSSHLVNKSIDGLDITKQSPSNMTKHILEQLPIHFKKATEVQDIFEKMDIQFHTKHNKVSKYESNFIVKLENPLHLHKLYKYIISFIKKKIPIISRGVRNLSLQERTSFIESFVKHSNICFIIHVKEQKIIFMPQHDFEKDNIMSSSKENKDIIVHVNTSVDTKTKPNVKEKEKSNVKAKANNYSLQDFVIQNYDSSLDIKFSDISLDLCLFNLGNNKEIISVKKIKVSN